MLQFWGSGIHRHRGDSTSCCRSPDPIGSPAFAQIEALFRRWYAWTVDLPGKFYLEVVEKLYKQNELAGGRFVALGETDRSQEGADAALLLAARDDEVVAPAQLFAAERLVGTPADMPADGTGAVPAHRAVHRPGGA